MNEKRSSPLRLLTAAVLLLAVAATAAIAQESDSREGIIDLRGSIDRQIAELEARLLGDLDLAAERQAALHLWLIELYDSTGRSDEVIRSYEKIVSLFPYDVGILNRYAQFMLERRKDSRGAEELVRNARQFAGLINVTDVDRGTTLYLQGSIDLSKERYQEAISAFTTAAFLCEEAPQKQLAALSQLTTALSLSGRYDEAVTAYLELLGQQGGYLPDELSRLHNLLNLAGRERTASPDRMIADAIEQERQARRERIEREGATLITIPVNNEITLEGTLYRGQHPGAVLYLVPSGGTRLVFRLFSQLLFTEGLSVLSLDLSGGGAHTSQDASGGREIQLAAVAAAISFLRERLSLDEDRIVLIAEDSVCETVELARFQHRLRCPTLYLSPLFDRNSKQLASSVPFRPDLPLMIMYSLEDRAVLLSLDYFRELKTLPSLEVLQLEKAGHGLEMLKRSPRALDTFLSWIAGVLNVPR